VQTELRVAILKALREANIEIPFNQVDVNLRDADGIKRYIAHQLEERADRADAPTSNGKRAGLPDS
jgi:small-conductance mechanosensitive channel